MTAPGVQAPPRTPEEWRVSELLKQYGCGPISFVGSENAFYDRHLVFDRVIDPHVATARERFEAFSHSIRDVLAQRWALTRSTYAKTNAKRVYYLSMEFLIGRSLTNNINNLLLSPVVQYAVAGERTRLARTAGAGTRCGSGQRRSGPPCSVLPRVHGHHATSGYGIRSAL